jgi:hypothetical protein
MAKRLENQDAFGLVREAAQTEDAESTRSNLKAEAKDLKHRIADAKAKANNPVAKSSRA